jgi:hypothetical protein
MRSKLLSLCTNQRNFDSWGNYLFFKIKPHFLAKNGGGQKKFKYFFSALLSAELNPYDKFAI